MSLRKATHKPAYASTTESDRKPPTIRLESRLWAPIRNALIGAGDAARPSLPKLARLEERPVQDPPHKFDLIRRLPPDLWDIIIHMISQYGNPGDICKAVYGSIQARGLGPDEGLKVWEWAVKNLRLPTLEYKKNAASYHRIFNSWCSNTATVPGVIRPYNMSSIGAEWVKIIAVQVADPVMGSWEKSIDNLVFCLRRYNAFLDTDNLFETLDKTTRFKITVTNREKLAGIDPTKTEKAMPLPMLKWEEMNPHRPEAVKPQETRMMHVQLSIMERVLLNSDGAPEEMYSVQSHTGSDIASASKFVRNNKAWITLLSGMLNNVRSVALVNALFGAPYMLSIEFVTFAALGNLHYYTSLSERSLDTFLNDVTRPASLFHKKFESIVLQWTRLRHSMPTRDTAFKRFAALVGTQLDEHRGTFSSTTASLSESVTERRQHLQLKVLCLYLGKFMQVLTLNVEDVQGAVDSSHSLVSIYEWAVRYGSFVGLDYFRSELPEFFWEPDDTFFPPDSPLQNG